FGIVADAGLESPNVTIRPTIISSAARIPNAMSAFRMIRAICPSFPNLNPTSRPKPDAIKPPGKPGHSVSGGSRAVGSLNGWEQIGPTRIGDEVFALQEVVAAGKSAPGYCCRRARYRDGLDRDRHDVER